VQESFRETVVTNAEEGVGPLAGVDKSRPIMMYCTGGIRCDVYSAVLREQGYDNLFTLEGEGNGRHKRIASRTPACSVGEG
jgi:predicted sulfurtransferase